MSRTLLRALATDNRGAALIEMALAAPFLSALVIGMTDMARGYSVKLQLEQAAQRAVEDVEQQKSVASSYNTAVTTDVTSAMSDAGYISGSYTVTPDSWVECSSDGTTWTRQTNFSDPCGSGQMTARYVKVTVSYNFSPLFASRAWPGANADGTIPISGFAEVRVQ